MYRKHFALTVYPFDLTPQPEDLFAAGSLRPCIRGCTGCSMFPCPPAM
jgi:hypothetical protein